MRGIAVIRGAWHMARIVFNRWPDPTFAGQYNHHLAAYQHGAAVHSNSWGDDFTNAYDEACRGIDSFQNEFDDNLIVFSVTNGGGTVRNPENAKNVLAVAASGEAPVEDFMCSGGSAPTIDGRQKPDVTAPGCSINSATWVACDTALASGTSMACPAVAGTALFARQYFVDGYYPTGAAVPGHGFVSWGPAEGDGGELVAPTSASRSSSFQTTTSQSPFGKPAVSELQGAFHQRGIPHSA